MPRPTPGPCSHLGLCSILLFILVKIRETPKPASFHLKLKPPKEQRNACRSVRSCCTSQSPDEGDGGSCLFISACRRSCTCARGATFPKSWLIHPWGGTSGTGVKFTDKCLLLNPVLVKTRGFGERAHSRV